MTTYAYACECDGRVVPHLIRSTEAEVMVAAIRRHLIAPIRSMRTAYLQDRFREIPNARVVRVKVVALVENANA